MLYDTIVELPSVEGLKPGMSAEVEVIMAQHTARKYFVEIQQLKHEQDKLNEEWGKLQLEQSTWAIHNRVESAAATKLGMVVPPPEQIVVIGEN